MASKRGTKASAADEIDELFEGINDSTAAPKKPSAKTAVGAKAGKPGDDILAELENELGEKAPSRPHTPRVREPAKPAKRTGTPNTDGPRQSLEESKPTLPRKSAESNRASFTPSATSSDLQEAEKSKGTVEQEQQAVPASTGGGWWGGILSTATAAMKQAEAAVKEMQQNEDAKKWADQMRGNVGALRGLGECRVILFIPARKDDGTTRIRWLWLALWVWRRGTLHCLKIQSTMLRPSQVLLVGPSQVA